MKWLSRLKSSDRNWEVFKNILAAFGIKGCSLIISVLLLPAYLRFFQDQTILGIWYTILSVLNWVLLFDLGLGNGLRNTMPAALESGNRPALREMISTTYYLMGGLAVAIAVVGTLIIPELNWNSIFNVSVDIIENSSLSVCVEIVFLGIMLQLVLKMITSILYALQKSALVSALSMISNLIILGAVSILPSGTLEVNLKLMSVVNVIAANLPFLVCTIVIFSKKLKDCRPNLKAVKKKYVRSIFNIGISLLWLQLVFMVITSTNEFMITNFTAPEYVVDYQAYYKVFKTGAMLVSLMLTPIWSAVTKAQSQGDYRWIKRVYSIFLAASAACLALELLILPILQQIMDIWLGEETIRVDLGYAVVFAFSSAMMVAHHINTAIGNGLSYFKVQMILMTVAAVACIPVSYLLVQWTGSWIGVVIGTTLVIVPYEFLAPVFTYRFLNKCIIQTDRKYVK